MTKFTRIAALAATTMLVGTAVNAASVNINTMSAAWNNAMPNNVTNLQGEGTSTLSWGTGNPQSSYVFDVMTTPALNVSNPFDLGTFTHNNYPITGTFLQSVDLDITVSGDIDGTAFSIVRTFTFTHTETSNVSSQCPGDPNPCPDKVDFDNDYSATEVVDMNGDLYTIILSGFQQGGVPVTSFLTQEGQANSAILQASWEIVPAPVPLPAAGVLLLGAVGGLGALRARRKRAA